MDPTRYAKSRTAKQIFDRHDIAEDEPKQSRGDKPWGKLTLNIIDREERKITALLRIANALERLANVAQYPGGSGG